MRHYGTVYAATLPMYAMVMGLIAPAPAQADVPEIKELVARKAEILGNMHRKAASAIVNVAQDEVFVEFFKAKDDKTRAPLKQRVDEITLRTQASFRVGEMCLIDKSGAEKARIVGNKVADDLSPDETGNPFFAPALAQRPRTAYIAPAYISQDVNKWVIAYATPIQVDGQTVGILHYEHDMSLYQHALDSNVPKGEHLLAVDKFGFVLADSAKEPSVDKREGADSPSEYFQQFNWAGGLPAVIKALGGGTSGAGTMTVDGKTFAVAFQPVQDWTVVGIEER